LLTSSVFLLPESSGPFIFRLFFCWVRDLKWNLLYTLEKEKKKENGPVLFIQSYQKLRCIWRVMYKTAGAGVCVWAGDLNAASGHQP
jgi:hypothetical protein